MKGIIMSGDHPLKVLDGTKTMTRRVIIPNLEAKGCQNSDIVRYCNTQYRDTFMFEVWHPSNRNTPLPLMIKCPYGQVGDRLWVRATWAKNYKGQMLFKYQYHSLNELLDLPTLNIQWKPSIHLHKEDAQIWLEITGLRAERVQEITKEDANKEGFSIILGNMDRPSARWYFKNCWDSLNAKRGYSWESNPWNWVIEFRKIQ